MLVKTFGSAIMGISAITITVEVDVDMGIQYFLVCLPDNAIKESHQRIESALKQVGYRFPGKQVVINMAPAGIRKVGSSYDLTIAIGILAASQQIDDSRLNDFIIMGELSLDGSINAVKGVLPMTLEAKRKGFKGIIIPKDNAQEAAVVTGIDIYGVENIIDVIGFLDGKEDLDTVSINVDELFGRQSNVFQYDFSEVKGQESIKRALEVAAAGGHNIMMIGSPGSGKTMLAKRLPSILPQMTLNEALETTKIHSVAGTLSGNSLISVRPFRAPHHTISDAGLVGGGSIPQPGEISLAHNGVLFLDELPEFKRSSLEVMRQPLEDNVVTISRARSTIVFPANFMLVAAMNPCPCGYYNHPNIPCTCQPGSIHKYLNKISGPLLDRIDIQIEVVPVPFNDLAKMSGGESSAEIRKRVMAARKIQTERFKNFHGIYSNSCLTSKMIEKYCRLDDNCMSILQSSVEKLNLSARAYNRILKVTRTIADLDASENIEAYHLSEAINYRSLDRESWGR